VSIRWGLCCQFVDAPIKFRVTTHRHLSTLAPDARREKLVQIARDNAATLARAVAHCHALDIGAFRINSQILPLATHPESGYTVTQLDEWTDGAVSAGFRDARDLARARGVRLSFHPDQFVVLNSEQPHVVEASLREMALQGEVAELVGADVVTLHAGSSAGGTEAALERLERAIDRLTPAARRTLALENDDRRFSPAQLLPLCERTGVPFVYDVHHHRCLPDAMLAMDVDEATDRAVATWRGREPSFHVSSPRDRTPGADPRPHADYVDPEDVPERWHSMQLTVDVEAKAKERAVLVLRDAFRDAPLVAYGA
jgi:UV DNA damage endonuclease